MATKASTESGDKQKVVRCDEYIDDQIRRTRRTVVAVDIASSILILLSVLLGSLVLLAVVEHWILPWGLNSGTRLLLFGAACLIGVWYLWRQVWPYLFRRVNPAYAAQTIEKNNPSLKNSLLNLLLLGRNRDGISDAVYNTLQQQAAQRLSHVPAEAAVDQSGLVRVTAIFAAAVVALVIYKAASPKDPFVTAKRVLMPWAEISAPSRVSIEDVEPGTTSTTRGTTLAVSAVIRGLRDDEQAVLKFTTADQQAVWRPVTMSSADGLHFECLLPPPNSSSSAGLQQDLRYILEAGDARTREFAVTVLTAPSILVTSVHYDYPEYTGYLNQTVKDIGDLQAIEGTKVTIRATGNESIKDAYVDFESDGRRDLTMQSKGNRAEVSFPLTLRPDRRTPQHTNYVLRMVTQDDRRNEQPVQHKIQVFPDYVPEVQILKPQERTRDVSLNETVLIELEARDPDFALSKVELKGEVAGRPVLDQTLLDGEHQGRFFKRFRFTPSRLGLQAGDSVDYWIEVRDNRTPQPNITVTDRQTFRILSPEPQKPGDEQVANRNRQQQNNNSDRNENQEQQQGNEQGQQQDSSDGGGQSEQQNQLGESGGQPNDQPGQDGGQGQENSSQQPGDDTSGQQQSQNQNNGGQQGSPEGENSSSQNRPGENSQQNENGASRSGQGGNQQKSKSNSQRPQQPVSPDGDQDAEAFERIQDHLNEQADGNQESNKEGEQQDESATSREGSRQAAQKPPEDQAGSREGGTADSQGAQEDGHQEKQERDSGAGDSNRGQKNTDQSQDTSPGGKQTSTEGPSGAGNQPGEKQRDTESHQETKPTEQWEQDASNADQQNDQESPPPGTGRRESNSKGEKGADNIGGAEEIGEKKPDRDGTGERGQSQSADEGTGESAERGKGRTSTSGGKTEQADRRTGQPGEETPGEGSSQREGKGEKLGGSPAERNAGKGEGNENSASGSDRSPEDTTGEGESSPNQSDTENGLGESGDGTQENGSLESNEMESEGDSGKRGAPRNSGGEKTEQESDRNDDTLGDTSTGGQGQFGQDTNPKPAADGGEPGGDAANLEYARRQTDMVLDKLSDMLAKKQVDEEMLDRLGWTEQDLQSFVNRWKLRKQQAQRNGDDGQGAKREWLDALRSLGLKRQKLGQSNQRSDDFRDLKEGVRVPVPPEFRDRLRAYNQGVSKSTE